MSSDATPLRAARSPFAFDLRAIGAFRIALAATILFDQVVRLGDWHAFHSVGAILTLADSQAWSSPWVWSLYWLSHAPALPYLLEALRLLATVALLLGIRSRLSAFVLFVALASVAARNPVLLQGGDKVLIVMTFFASFLPLGQRFSLSALWFGQMPDHRYLSAATGAYAVQVLLVWFMAGALKTGEAWWADGTAISMALHLEAFASEFARLWRHWDWLLRPLTFFVFWLELLAPLLVLVPMVTVRSLGLLALVALEFGIWLNLEVGLFPLISVVSLIPLVPCQIVDRIVGWRQERASDKGSELTLFVDANCQFCAFACRLLLAFSGIRGASVRIAQSDTIASSTLEQECSWSVTDRAAPGAYSKGMEAVLFVLKRSPRPWLAHLVPPGTRGERVYGWIRRYRGALGKAGRLAFGTRPDPGRHAPVGHAVAVIAIISTVAWNAASYPTIRDWADVRSWIMPVMGTLNIAQYWDMFAPQPYSLRFVALVGRHYA